MLDITYDVPLREGIKECSVTEAVITKQEAPQLVFEKEKKIP
jgi:ATP-dependent Clp protease ATP-binding subunit ClpX